MALHCNLGRNRTAITKLAVLLLLLAQAQPGRVPGATEPEDVEFRCRRQLRLQAEAIAAYRQHHQGNFPTNLGDLYPNYLQDPRLLQCPAAVDGGTSGIAQQGLVDPSLRDARVLGYGYECGLEEPSGWASWELGMRFAEFKTYQRRSLVGRYVPVVRCAHHGTNRVLNLCADGTIYESGDYWESSLIDRIPSPRLHPLLIRDADRPMAALVPQRPPDTAASMLDLRPHYNARFEDPWALCDHELEQTQFTRDRHALGGLIRSANTAFDAAGIIQLGGRLVPEREGTWYGFTMPAYPPAVRAITVGQRFRVMHVLGAVLFADTAGTPTARLILHRPGSAPETWTWRYGEDVLAFRFVPGTPEPELKTTAVGWRGAYVHPQSNRAAARLFHLKHVNPHPDQPVSHIDFEAGDSPASPFIVAITLE